jgi:hypothetical protein
MPEDVVPPPLPEPSAPPTSSINCWKCGYDLRGLQVTDNCPECGTPVWSTPAGMPQQPVAQIEADAMTWGVVSLVLVFFCLGPLAGFVAIPAVVKGRRAMALVNTGRVPKHLATQARTGMILGWVTIGVSIAILALYGGLFVMGAMF